MDEIPKQKLVPTTSKGTAPLEPRTDEDAEMSRTLTLIMKQSLYQSFGGPAPERSITCVIASIYDVDEERDVVYANTEDVACLVPQGNAASISIRAPLVARLVTDSERYLALSESPALPGETTDSPEASTTRQYAPPAGTEAGIRTDLLETPGEASTQTESPVAARETSGTSPEFVTTRVKVREEDGRLSIDIDGEHYLLDGAELSEDQT